MSVYRQAPAAQRGMSIGEWNVAIGVVGAPGGGKSTYAQARVREIIAKQQCYVVAHDPTLSIKGPDVTRHQTEQSLLATLASPGRAKGIHTLDVADGLRVIKLGLTVAAAARSRPNPVPTLVVIDEIVACGNMSPSYLDELMREAYALRRSRHIGFVFCSQRPQQAHPTIWELATELVCFRCATPKQLATLAEYGVPASRVTGLPYFWHPQAQTRPPRIPEGAPVSRRLHDCYIIHHV